MPKRQKTSSPHVPITQIQKDSSLLTAIEENNNFAVGELLAAKADPNVLDKFGRPAIWSYMKRHENNINHRIINKLLRAGAKLDESEDEQRDLYPPLVSTPLELAVKNDTVDDQGNRLYVSLTKTLLRAKANPNFPGIEGTTPLQYLMTFTSRGQTNLENIVESLLIRGAKNMPDSNGCTPLHRGFVGYAFRTTRTMKLLSDNCNVNEKLHKDMSSYEKEGDTALHVLCRNEYIYRDEILTLLLEKGGNFYAENAKGETPYSLTRARNLYAEGYLKAFDSFRKIYALKVRDALDFALVQDTISLVIEYAEQPAKPI